jgi:hypothetical protein
MKITVFWDLTLCNLVETSPETSVPFCQTIPGDSILLLKHITLDVIVLRRSGMWRSVVGALFYIEGGGCVFLRNFGLEDRARAIAEAKQATCLAPYDWAYFTNFSLCCEMKIFDHLLLYILWRNNPMLDNASVNITWKPEAEVHLLGNRSLAPVSSATNINKDKKSVYS